MSPPPSEDVKYFFGCNQCTAESTGRYQPIKMIGKGSYGTVCSAIDLLCPPGDKVMVAIKRISNVFEYVPEAVRIFREIFFLRAMHNSHPDIVRVRDILMPRSVLGFRDVYIVFDLMDTSLRTVIDKHHESLSIPIIRTFMHQMLSSIAFIHRAGIMHRDLKPENMLVNTLSADGAPPCLKLCDFGLARGNHLYPAPQGRRTSKRETMIRSRERISSICSYLMSCGSGGDVSGGSGGDVSGGDVSSSGSGGSGGSGCSGGSSDKYSTRGSGDLLERPLHMWTDYVSTRWYRAPELCGSFFPGYTTAVDMWSAGCIFGEMLVGFPILRGTSIRNQLKLIVQMLGQQSNTRVSSIENTKSQEFVRAVSFGVKEPGFDCMFQGVDCPDALDLLRQMLSFSPEDRPSAEEALLSPFFSGLDQPSVDQLRSAERTRSGISRMTELDVGCDRMSEHQVRTLIFDEISEWRESRPRSW